MSAILDVNVSAACGRLGRLYTKYGLCPPFALRDAVERWIARDIPLAHCVSVIERYLSRHAGRCNSGSGDWNFAWLSNLIQTSWNERSSTTPPRPSPQENNRQSRLGDTGTDEQSFQAGHRTPYTQRPPNPPGARSAVSALSRAVTRKSDLADQIIPLKCHRYGSPGKSRAPGPKKIHLAIAWLLTELATGEEAASVVEAEAVSAGIAPRTYDRARKRLGVTSRRIGFGRRAKYMIALPAAYATPKVESNGRAQDEKRQRKKGR